MTSLDLTPAGPPDMGPSNQLVIDRPYEFDEPDSYDGSPTPLVVLLHGYSVRGSIQRALFLLGPAVNAHGFFLAYPDGTVDSQGNRFWNATDACCNRDQSTVDDVAYIDAVIDDMRAHYNIDPRRIYLTGHSNGAFMAHRYACDRAHRVAAIVALAGDTWKDPSKCAPSEPVAVVQAHGDKDESIPYDGRPGMPSAKESVTTWAGKNGCTLMPTDTSQPPLDLDKGLPGAETTRERFTGCKSSGAAELWTIVGGGHVPGFSTTWTDEMWRFFAAHPKP